MPEGAVNNKPPEAKFFRFLSLGVIASVFGGIAVWSVLAPINGAVIAPGQIVVESNRKTVQHLEGGVIGEILIREGQLVDAGDVLLRLQDTAPRSNLQLIDGQLAEFYARRARLTAERDGLEQPSRAEGLDAVIQADAFAAKLKGQRQLLDARLVSRKNQISLLEERITQQNERIGGLKAQIESLSGQRRLIADELEGVRKLYEKGFAPLTRLRALEREEKRLQGERGALSASVAEAQSIIAEARLEIVRLNDAAREEAITELRDVEVSIAELEERRITAADAFERTQIRAPQSGRVLALAVHTVGGVITPGEALMEIVPSADHLQIASKVSPQDIDKVTAGQETLIRFTGFGGRKTPEVSGAVSTVSADSLVDQMTGASYYLVLIDLPGEDEVRRVLNNQALTPGMPAETYIRTGARPAISYFLKPLNDAFARAMKEE